MKRQTYVPPLGGLFKGLAAWRKLAWVVGVLLISSCDAAPAQGPPTSAPAAAKPVAPTVPVLIKALLAQPQATGADLDALTVAELRAFYGAACAPAWTSTDSARSSAAAVLALLAQARDYGLRPSDYRAAALQALRDSVDQAITPENRQLARLDVGLTAAALRFAGDVSRGRLRPYSAADTLGVRAGKLRAALRQHRLPGALLAGQPRHREYRQLQQALAQWLARPLPPDSQATQQARFEQAALNLERWRWQPIADSEYVLINIAAYELQVVSGDSLRQRHRVVVGKPQTPTPTLSSRIRYFTLAPEWRVPRSIATREMLPRLKRGSAYLQHNDLALYDRQGR